MGNAKDIHMMKHSKFVFTVVTLLLSLISFSGASWAQGTKPEISNVDASLQELNNKEALAQAQIRPLQVSTEQLKLESDKIKAALTQNESQLAALKDTSLTLSLKIFEELVLKHAQGGCVITQSTSNPYEFNISKGDTKIRFVLAAENSVKKPTIKKIIVNNTEVVEYSQPGWSDKNSSAETFRATIQIAVKTSENEETRILRSTFNGERIDERGLLGLFLQPLPAESPVSCYLGGFL
jgi:hypothetical protein